MHFTAFTSPLHSFSRKARTALPPCALLCLLQPAPELLKKGTPLPWKDALEHLEFVRNHGIQQFINVFNNVKARQNDCLKWGDEVGGVVVMGMGRGGGGRGQCSWGGRTWWGKVCREVCLLLAVWRVCMDAN